MKTFSREETRSAIERIRAMTDEELVRFWRFTPPGDPHFTNDTLVKVMEDRIQVLRASGNFSKISKAVGWDTSPPLGLD